MNEIMQEREGKQHAFDENTQAYVSKYAMDNLSKLARSQRIQSNIPLMRGNHYTDQQRYFAFFSML